MSVCFWESGDISRLNDDAVIGLYDLIVERDVTERAPIPLLYPCYTFRIIMNCTQKQSPKEVKLLGDCFYMRLSNYIPRLALMAGTLASASAVALS